MCPTAAAARGVSDDAKDLRCPVGHNKDIQMLNIHCTLHTTDDLQRVEVEQGCIITNQWQGRGFCNRARTTSKSKGMITVGIITLIGAIIYNIYQTYGFCLMVNCRD